MAEQPRDDEAVWVRPYVVLFCDVLNQREAIRRLERLPTDELERNEYIRAIKNSKGKVEGLRRIISSFFNSYLSSPPVTPPAGLDLVQLAAIKAWRGRKASLSMQSFSDTVVAFAPVVEDGGIVPVDSIYAMLNAAGAAMFTCLAAGTPIRGGLDLNVGLAASENDLYGPAFVGAYDLESKVAEWPRIVIGPNVIKLLEDSSRPILHTNATLMNASVAQLCGNLIAVADDNRPFVHFALPILKNALGSDASMLFNRGHTFAQQEHDRLKAQPGHERLAERYRILRTYYEIHAQQWQT